MVANPKAVQTKIKKEPAAKPAAGAKAVPKGSAAEVNKTLNARILILSPDLNNAMLGR